MFFFFPAGLVLYWITNNVLSIAQQWLINTAHGRAAAVQPAEVRRLRRLRTSLEPVTTASAKRHAQRALFALPCRLTPNVDARISRPHA